MSSSATKNLLSLFSLFFVTLGCFAQTNPAATPPAPALPAPPPDVEMVEGVEIGQGGGRPLHAEIAYPKNKTAAPMPAVLLIHGGGWVGGKPSDFLHVAYSLASRGYFAACPEYRLRGEAKWPAQIEDCKLAVRWLRANAATYNVNPDKIGCWGNSAGGHLVACLGTMDDQKFEGTGGYPGISSKVQAVSDWCGPTDFTDGNFGNGNDAVTPDQKQRDLAMLNDLLGATFAQNPVLWKEASPLTWVKAGDPPFIIVNGDHDQIVATAQGIKFANALQKAGVPVQLIIVKNGDHSMGAAPGLPPAEPTGGELDRAVLAFFDKYLKGT
jgi:acetyl esterase/lipase